MKEYNKILQYVLEEGIPSDDRTGVGTLSAFGYMFEFDMSNGLFPAVTNKKLAWKAVVSELLWFIRGSSNVHELRKILHGPRSMNKTIWDENYEDMNRRFPDKFFMGNLGPVYGKQWRGDFGRKPDQLKKAIEDIMSNPDSRRIIVNSWAPNDLEDMALPPCHYSYQFRVQDGKLHLAWNQRSNDTVLGTPFNIASYALLMLIVCRITGLKPGKLIGFMADVHIYNNAIEAARTILSREPFPLPRVFISEDLKTLGDFENATVSDFQLIDYEHHEAIKVPMAV